MEAHIADEMAKITSGSLIAADKVKVLTFTMPMAKRSAQ
jgi:hypothetical protein